MDNTPWYKQAIFYEVYIRAFADSNGDGNGDFLGLTLKLDYIRELGIDCIWIMPMYPSPLKDDGYDISDYYNIHPDYGTLEDFKKFLAEAHARGLKVITDLVLNHTSDQHPWFQAARSYRNSPYRDYYVWSDTPDKYKEARIIFLDTETSNWAWDEQAGQYYWHRFYTSQPDLNFDSPAVQDEMIQVMNFWLDLGIDGFRVDAVPYLYEREGTNCENLPETHVYLKRIREFVDEHFNGKVLLCEANQWPEDVRAYFGDGDEFNMGFNFPVMPRIYMALAFADRTPVVNITRKTPEIPENCQWCTFLRNHDELTLEMVTPEERDFMWQTYSPDLRMRLNLGIRRRLAPLLDGDRRKIELLNSILFTLPGSPILYYGDEIGMGDNIWLKDRDGVRTPMQWSPGPNAGFSTAPKEMLYSQPISEGEFGCDRVIVDQQRADPKSLWHTIKNMISLRKEWPVFGCGGAEIIEINNLSILAIIRHYQDETILAIHNLSGEAQQFEVDLQIWQGKQIYSLLTKENLPPVTGELYPLSLPPYGYMWLNLGG